MTQEINLCDCGHPPSPTNNGFTTGYGKDPVTGKTSCYACCAEHDKQIMRDTGELQGYLTVKYEGGRPREPIAPGRYRRNPVLEVTFSNWPGSLKIHCPWHRIGEHCCWGGPQTRVDAWFPFEGHVWHVVQRGDNNEVGRAKRTKELWQLINPEQPERGYHAVRPRARKEKKHDD